MNWPQLIRSFFLSNLPPLQPWLPSPPRQLYVAPSQLYLSKANKVLCPPKNAKPSFWIKTMPARTIQDPVHVFRPTPSLMHQDFTPNLLFPTLYQFHIGQHPISLESLSQLSCIKERKKGFNQILPFDNDCVYGCLGPRGTHLSRSRWSEGQQVKSVARQIRTRPTAKQTCANLRRRNHVETN